MKVLGDPSNLAIRLGLIRVQKAARLLGNPQEKLRKVVHIAGTNGKGSTLSFLKTLLLSSNPKLTIGLYSSPHLLERGERFQTNWQTLSASEYRSLEEQLEAGLSPEPDLLDDLTVFERLTLIAFLHFANKPVDYLLLETGLGGRLDATNIVSRPALCLFTNVGLDHQEFLGETVAQIAWEKAGILKPAIPFCSTAEGIAREVIVRRASQLAAPEWPLSETPLATERIWLPGAHQIDNARLAISAWEYLNDRPASAEILEALDHPQPWPQGRFQEIELAGRRVVLDGAHNPPAAEVLAETLAARYPGRPRIYLLGLLASKDSQGFLSNLLNSTDRAILSRPSREMSSHDPAQLKVQIQALFPGIHPPEVVEDVAGALDLFRRALSESPGHLGIVCGSLYLLGTVLGLLRGERVSESP